ncbi:hypothetical protein PINS_up008330 [Pythium insidiosum]|nr:hypothetical protein PINS_up008330 [Pythium insidiosum]
MATELATAIPACGGPAYWIALAFGPRLGFQAGYWSWVLNCIACSVYAAASVNAILGGDQSTNVSFLAFVIKSSFALVLALPCIWSLRAVGNIAIVLSICVMLPYIIISVWGVTEAQQWDVLLAVRQANITTIQRPDGTNSTVASGPTYIDYYSLFQSLVWSYTGYYNVSVYIEQVKNPVHAYRRSLWMCYVAFPAHVRHSVRVAACRQRPQLDDLARMFAERRRALARRCRHLGMDPRR